MRTMYDAIDVNNLPTGGDLYAGYDDGNWPDADAIAKRFPGKLVLKITVRPSDNNGIIGDGPPDNGTWQQWVGWVEMRRKSGVDPWINTNQSSWAAGKAAFAAAKVAEPHWWIAHYDNDPTIPAGALMKQYASNAKYDTSSCAAYLPGIDPAPAPATSVVIEEDDMAQQIEPLSVHATEYAYDVPAKAAYIKFGVDGYGGQARLRVVMWNGQGNQPAVDDGVLIGASERYKPLSLPPGTTHVTVRREDNGNFPVSVGFA